MLLARTGRTLLLLAATLAAALGTSTAVHACVCNYAAPCETFWKADAVFVGHVTAIDARRGTFDLGGGPKQYELHVATFAVDEAFRGVEGGTVEVLGGADEILEGGIGRNTCSTYFSVGGRFIVYAVRGPETGMLAIDKCLRGRPFASDAEIEEDVAYGRRVVAGKVAPGVRGVLSAEFDTRDSNDVATAALAGTKVVLEGPGGRYVLPVGSDGGFHEEGIAPGTYRVRAELPKGYRIVSPYSTESVVVQQGCALVQLSATRLGSVAGRAIDGAGRPVKTTLRLLSLGPEGADGTEEVRYAESHDDGEFLFEVVPTGSYRLAVNPKGPEVYVRDQDAYPATFFPGVSDEARATVVRVAEGEPVRVKDFRLPPPLEIVSVDIVVRDAAGGPAAFSSVSLRYADRGDDATTGAEADADGRAVLRMYKGRVYRLWADAIRGDSRVTSGEVVLTAGSGPERVTLTLRSDGAPPTSP